MWKILAFALLGLLAGPVSAAEITVIERNPIYFDGWWRYFRDPIVADYRPGGRAIAYEDFEGCDLTDPACGDPKTPDALAAEKRRMIEGLKWRFDGGLTLDGALSFDQIMTEAAVLSAERGRVIRIAGKILPGDLAKLKAVVADEGLMDCLAPGYCPFNNVIALDSPGGTLTEALRIAQYVRANSFITLLPEGSDCASACSLIFLSGFAQYEGVFHPRRFAVPGARLGLHQPFLRFPKGSYSAADVEELSSVLNGVLNDVTALFVDAGLTLPLLHDMYATPPEGMYYLTPTELAQVAITYDRPEPPRIEMTRDKVLALCGDDYKARYGRYPAGLPGGLRLWQNGFIAWVPHEDYLCFGGARDGIWTYDICPRETGPQGNEATRISWGDDNHCSLVPCLWEDDGGACTDEVDFIFLEAFSNEVAGDALAWSDPANIEALVNAAVAGAPEPVVNLGPTFTPRGAMVVPGWVQQATTPQAYCGQIDAGRPGFIAQLRDALQAAGFPSETVATSIDRSSLVAANRALTGRDGDSLDAPLLRALNLPEPLITELTLCAGP